VSPARRAENIQHDIRLTCIHLPFGALVSEWRSGKHQHGAQTECVARRPPGKPSIPPRPASLKDETSKNEKREPKIDPMPDFWPPEKTISPDQFDFRRSDPDFPPSVRPRFSRFRIFPIFPDFRSSGGASNLSAPSRIAQELKWAGIDLLSLAYNHAVDWGVTGMLSTIHACKKAGIVGAGTGRDLEEARGPAFCEKDKGRVALISTSSPNSAPERAGLPKGSIPGRPGVNCIRMNYKYEVDHSTAEQLRALGKKLDVLTTNRDKPQEFNLIPFNGESDFAFVDGNTFEVRTSGHPKDVEGNLRAIEEARQMADIVIFAYHMELTDGAGAAGRKDLMCPNRRCRTSQHLLFVPPPMKSPPS
jgi:hypothetical protein